MPNVIFRGPITAQPTTKNLPVAGAYLPGILVTDDGSEFTVATAADIEKDLQILTNAAFMGQDITTAYVSGDTGVSYDSPQPGEVYQVRMGAGTYAKDAPLTVGAAGRFVAATAGQRVMAWYSDTGATLVDDALADVKIANSFNLAAA